MAELASALLEFGERAVSAGPSAPQAVVATATGGVPLEITGIDPSKPSVFGERRRLSVVLAFALSAPG